ncbi:MAG: DUF5808 domain-containing protein [Mycoplasmatales bacterium]
MILGSISVLLLSFLSVIIIPVINNNQYFFGVSIPHSGFENKEIKSVKLKFYKINTIGVMVCSIVAFLLKEEVLIMLVPMCLYIIISGVSFILCFKDVKVIKTNNNWNKLESKKIIIDTNFKKNIRVISYKYYLLLFAINTILTGYIISIYDTLPDKIPSHINLNGVADAFGDKKEVIVTFVIISYLITLLFIGINFSFTKIKQNLNHANPEVSSIKTIDYIYSSSIVLFYFALIITTISSGSLLLTVEAISILMFNILSIICLILFLVCLFRLYKISAKRNRETPINNDIFGNDDNWYYGAFYFNKNDPSLFVEKRVGIGWTVNFGNKGVVIVLVLIFLIIIIAILNQL